MAILNYRDLVVWQKAMDFVVEVYTESQCLPKEETYGLKSQIRRAVVSIPSNIAEGHGRRGDRQFAQFLHVAHGSLREVETQLMICDRLEFMPSKNVQLALDKAAEVGRLTNGLLNRLESP